MNIENDLEFMNIVKNILDSDDFNKLRNIEHHGTTRYNHSIKVAYKSYRMAKRMRLDYKAVAKAGLMHDFFLSEVGRGFKTRILSTFTHPKKASKNAMKFGISDKEKNIIESHMFPFCLTLPLYFESWIVIVSDKFIGMKEFVCNWKNNFKFVTNFTFLIFLSLIK